MNAIEVFDFLFEVKNMEQRIQENDDNLTKYEHQINRFKCFNKLLICFIADAEGTQQWSIDKDIY